MALVKARGVIVNEYKSGESDKVLILLTKEMGKISVYAKSARKPKSKYASAQLFTYADFVLFSGKDFYSIIQIDIIENFSKIRSDYERICYANYFLEVIDKTSFKNSDTADILYLLLMSLSALNLGKHKLEFIRCVFEFKFMQLSGYEAESINCKSCGSILKEDGKHYFSIEGYICESCVKTTGIYVLVGYAALYTINYIMLAEIKDVFKFSISDKVLVELINASELLIKNIDIQLNSKRFLATVIL